MPRYQRASDPASEGAAITPSDTSLLANVSRGLFIGVGGDVKVDLRDVGTGLVFKNVVAGTVLPVMAKKVYATGTTATNIIVLY